MESKISVTYEIDDLDLAVEELTNGLEEGFQLKENSCGILFCDSDMEQDALVKLLKEKISFDIIGCTGIATMDKTLGFHEMAAVFIVLTADDCEFQIGVSGTIHSSNVTGEIEALYDLVRSNLSTDPKLIFALPPYDLNIMLDEYVNVFNRIAEGVPVLGGLPSHNENGDHNLVFHNDKVYSDRIVIMTVAGKIRPVFDVQNVEGTAVERKRTVTSAKGNTIYQVGSQTFAEYLSDCGLDVERLAVGNHSLIFLANPLLVENVMKEDGKDYSFVRTIHELHLEDGSGTAIGHIPEGATVSISSLRREEIEQAASKGMDNLVKQMRDKETDGYQYSTVLMISCIGRYLLMSPKSNVEVNQLVNKLPAHLNMGGFYSYGEISPLLNNPDSVNFAHNVSMVLCAF